MKKRKLILDFLFWRKAGFSFKEAWELAKRTI